MNIFRTALVTLALTVSASAQNAPLKIQYISAFSKGGVIPKDCAQVLTLITPMITAHSPKGWTWIVACDEPSWKRVEDHMGQLGVEGRILASSDLTYRITYVRGEDVLHPFNDTAEAQPQHTIAHELGHILLNTHNEAKAEKKATELLNAPALVAKN